LDWQQIFGGEITKVLDMNNFIRILSAIGFLFISGCGRQAPQPQPSFEDKYLSHVVKYPGETLAGIAKWYTGKPENWKEIAKVNPDLTPEKIRIKDVIVIPRDIIVKSDPLPKPDLKVTASKIDQVDGVVSLEKQSDAIASGSEETLPLTKSEEAIALEEHAPIGSSNVGMVEAPIGMPDGGVADEVVVEPTKDPNFGKPRPPEASKEEDDRLRSRDDLIQEILSRQ